MDLEYIVLPSRVKENIILQSPQDISYYVVTVYTESLSGVPSTSYWTITYNSLGYAIKRLGSNGLAMAPSNDTPASGTVVVVSPYSSTNTARHWSLERVSSPPAGALLYDTATQNIVTNPSKYMSSGETKSLSDFNLCAAAYSDATNSQTFYWYSSNQSVATVNSSTGAVTGVSPGTTVITGRVSRGGSYHYVHFGVCVNLPELFTELIDLGCIQYELCDATDDGLFLSTVPISEILLSKGIATLPRDTSGSDTKDVLSYDDWYIYAVDNGTEVSYGLFKMRGNESGSGAIGVAISFISIDCDALINCLRSPTFDNKYNLYLKLTTSTGPEASDHDDVLAHYFAQVESTGAYLIAEKYAAFMAGTASNGTIVIPETCVELINETKMIDDLLSNPSLDSDTIAALYMQRQKCARIPDALKNINEIAGYTIYDSENLTLSIADPSNLTLYEKQAILSCYTANVTFNSFAAEVQFHAAAIFDEKSDYSILDPLWYDKAVIADMSIGEEAESGFYDEYYNLDSDIVQAQIAEHGEY